MALKKQEFYEGAALHLLARTGNVRGVRYDPPLFCLNDRLLLHLKYSTKGRSPWGFTFLPEEQVLLRDKARTMPLVIGLICGSDGVAAVPYDAFNAIVEVGRSAAHIACYRSHGEHYAVTGPAGRLSRKIPPSNWPRILEF